MIAVRESDLGSMGERRTKGEFQWNSEKGERSCYWDSEEMVSFEQRRLGRTNVSYDFQSKIYKLGLYNVKTSSLAKNK